MSLTRAGAPGQGVGSGQDGVARAARGGEALPGVGGRAQNLLTPSPRPTDLLAEYCEWLPQAMHADVEKAWPPTADR